MPFRWFPAIARPSCTGGSGGSVSASPRTLRAADHAPIAASKTSSTAACRRSLIRQIDAGGREQPPPFHLAVPAPSRILEVAASKLQSFRVRPAVTDRLGERLALNADETRRPGVVDDLASPPPSA